MQLKTRTECYQFNLIYTQILGYTFMENCIRHFFQCSSFSDRYERSNLGFRPKFYQYLVNDQSKVSC